LTKETNLISKIANTDFPIHNIIARRWSARAFSTKTVEKSKLLSILEAARWAPSSRNEQPWRYIVFTDDNPEKLEKARSVLLEINKVIPKHLKQKEHNNYYHFMRGLCVVPIH
jgi:nitroreductase